MLFECIFLILLGFLAVPAATFAPFALGNGLRLALALYAQTQSTDLDQLSRKELQALAKANSIKANIASAEIIRQLQVLTIFNPAVVDAAAEQTLSKPDSSVIAPSKLIKSTKSSSSSASPAKTQPTKPSSGPDGIVWSSADYGKAELEEWWRSIPGPLLTVGAKGVAESHARSLVDLLRGHSRVRVRFSSDKLDASAMAHDFLSKNPTLEAGAELLLVKRREFMIQRSQAAPRGTWPKLAQNSGSRVNAQRGDICHGCGQVGHHRIECPNFNLPGFYSRGTHPNAEILLDKQKPQQQQKSSPRQVGSSPRQVEVKAKAKAKAKSANGTGRSIESKNSKGNSKGNSNSRR